MSGPRSDSGLMTPEERLEALERLESRQQQSQRVAVRAVWGSVVAATVVLALVIGFGTWEVRSLGEQRQRLGMEIKQLRDRAEAAKTEASEAEEKQREAEAKQREAEARQRAVASALGKVPEAQRKAAVEQQVAAAPQTATLLPRIYMQIVNPDDKPRAEKVREALQRAGYLVLGIETVTRAANLKMSDVRYYRDQEGDEAKRIADVMKGAGESPVSAYLPERYRNNPNVRPNHFEVWLVHKE